MDEMRNYLAQLPKSARLYGNAQGVARLQMDEAKS